MASLQADHAQIFTLLQMVAKRTAKNMETLVFTDLEKPYDTAPIKKLFEILERSTVYPKYINAFRDIYDVQESVVKTPSQISKLFKCTKGFGPQLYSKYILIKI